MAGAISVIGIGNTLMGDDGVGVRLAEQVRPLLADDPRVEVVTGGTAGMALMPHVLTADAIVFLDALAAGAEPGSIFRFDPDAAGVTQTRSHTSHGVGIPYLITSARLQGHWPSFVIVAVHVGDTMLGPDRLSAPVEAALPRASEIVVEEVRSLLNVSQAAASDTPSPRPASGLP